MYNYSELSQAQSDNLRSLLENGNFIEIKKLVIGKYNVMRGCSSCTYNQVESIKQLRKHLDAS